MKPIRKEGPIRVGIIGLGVGLQHAEAYHRTAGCEVTALCDFSEERLALARARFPRAKASRRAEEILADPEVDVVSIASYDHHHADQVLQALRAGKHVFVEKPLCQTWEQLAAIREAWAGQRDRVRLSSNLILRTSPLYQWLRQRIAAGDLGRIYAFDGDYLYGRISKITEGWRKEVENYSVMEGGGVHMVDLMLWLTGERPVQVAAAGNRICTEGTAFRYPDYVAATFRFASGQVGRITANFGCVHRHQHVLRIFGTKATFIYDDAGPRLHLCRDPSVAATAVELSALPRTKGDRIPGFLEAIRDGRDISGETQQMLEAMAACIACDRALASGRWEEVIYP